MALSINPLAKLVNSVSSQVGAAAQSAQASLASTDTAALKANVDATVGRLSGALGSGLNGATAAANTMMAQAGTALKGVGSPIQSLASNAADGGSALGSLGGIAGAVSNAGAVIGASLDKLGLASGGLGGGLAKLATGISSAAGMINNLLSMARGKNLPSGAELFTQQGAFAEVKPGMEDDWRVKLNCNFGLFGSAFSRLSATNGFVWPYLPTITVASKANYTQIDPVHNLQPFYAYKNSQIDDIQISGEFSVETELDAQYWIQGTTFLRTATKMFFGKGPNVGNPPVICNLTGYGARVFNSVPVIIKSFSVDFKDDVNYIKCSLDGANTWVPIMSTISVTVAPIYNRTKLRQFSLNDYAAGKTVGYL